MEKEFGVKGQVKIWATFDGLANALTAITLGKEYQMPVALTEIKISNPELYDSYVGRYEFISGTHMDIIKEDNNLYAQLTGQEKFEIFLMSESEYFYKIIDANISFIGGEDGKVINLVLHQNGQNMPAPKINFIKMKPLHDLICVIYRKEV